MQNLKMATTKKKKTNIIKKRGEKKKMIWNQPPGKAC